MIGILFILVGFCIRLIAIRTLGKDFTFNLKIPSKIVTTGLYKYIRHPSYLGSLLMILGTSLINPVFGIMTIAYAVFVERMSKEDYLLLQKPEYQNYYRCTGAITPKIRRK